MGDFKKLNARLYQRKQSNKSPDADYWKKFTSPVFLKEFGPVDYIDFSVKEPHYFAVTSSVRVQVYSPITRLLHKNLNRFQKSAYGGSFRNDGRLLCSGSEEASVKLFDIASKSLLRVFKGHSGPVHRCFFTADSTRLASFSDDGSVALWDIPGETRLSWLNEHSDYVRAGCVSPVSPDILLSGGYDGVINMYDVRNESAVFTVKHESPVESLLFLPSGGIFLSAGGNEIKVWDAFAGGRLLTRLHHHHKTVTCLRLASNGTRLLSSSLDRHVNVYDIGSYTRLHSITYPNSILSLGISPNDETIAVGMVDGLVSVCRKEPQVEKKPKGHRRIHPKLRRTAAALTVQSEEQRARWLKDYDKHLKRFEHTKALNCVLTPFFVKKRPETAVIVLKELLSRKALHAAVSGNEERTLVPLLRLLNNHIGDVRFYKILCQVSQVLLDVYEDKLADCGPNVVSLFKKLKERVDEEIEVSQDLLSLEGSLHLLLSAASFETTSVDSMPSLQLKPSPSAQGFVVNVS